MIIHKSYLTNLELAKNLYSPGNKLSYDGKEFTIIKTPYVNFYSELGYGYGIYIPVSDGVNSNLKFLAFSTDRIFGILNHFYD